MSILNLDGLSPKYRTLGSGTFGSILQGDMDGNDKIAVKRSYPKVHNKIDKSIPETPDLKIKSDRRKYKIALECAIHELSILQIL